MPIKKTKPTSAGRRFQSILVNPELSKERPEKSLTEPLKKTGGRNNYGRVTLRFRGGGHKRLYRLIDFKRDKDGVPAKVISLEYDPNRSANIALLQYQDGEKRYILAPDGLKVGDTVISGDQVDIKIGNALPLKNIPVGTMVHNVELRPGKGGQIAKSAGAFAQILGKERDYVILRLPSGEIRKVHGDCKATIGQVGNLEWENVVWGKAGRIRWRGRKPHVRGVAMNPVDHPLGGGEGKTHGGRHPCSPWGQLAKGLKTRKKKSSDSLIIKRRKG